MPSKRTGCKKGAAGWRRLRGSGRDGCSRRAVMRVDAYKVTGDPKSGEYDDPVFLVRLGSVPRTEE